MVYCQRCGTKNDDDAKFCKNCSASLIGPRRAPDKEWEEKCDEECAARGRSAPVFWAIILALIGLWIVFEFGIKNIEGLPQEIYDFQFWWVIPVVIGLAIIVAAVRMLIRER